LGAGARWGRGPVAIYQWPRTSNYYPKEYRRLTDRAATLDEICELFYRRRISFHYDQIDSLELGMGTAEWIALGLLSFIALIGWLRWESTREDHREMTPAEPPQRQAGNVD
jgi:hypothetical protein